MERSHQEAEHHLAANVRPEILELRRRTALCRKQHPHTVLIDGEGTILARGLHGDELQEKIAEAVK